MAARILCAKEALPYTHRKLAPLPAAKAADEQPPTGDEAAWESDLPTARPN